MTADALTTGLTVAGALAGIPLAWISARLSGGARPSLKRLAAFALAAAVLGLWSGLARPEPIPAVLTMILGWQLILLAVVDGEHFWLPDLLTWPLAASGLIAAIPLPELTVRDSLIGAVTGFVALWLLATVFRRVRERDGLGGGDPFMLAGAGAWVGWIGLPSVLLWAAVGGLSLVAARIITGRRVAGTDRLPFGVFLAVGVWLTWLLGPIGLWR